MADHIFGRGGAIDSTPLTDTSDDELPASASPEGVQQFERMFEDAVNVREELEEALGEFMLMGDKAKGVLEEELLKYEAMHQPHMAQQG